MWRKFLDFLEHPVVQFFGGPGIFAVITWLVTRLAKLPVWEIWLAVIFALGLGLWIVNQIGLARERSKKRLTKLSDEDLENTVRGWLDNPGMEVTRLPNDAKHYFAFRVRYTDNMCEIIVSRMKTEPGYIAIQGIMDIVSTKEMEFSGEELARIGFRIGLELARASVYFAILPEAPSKPKARHIRIFNWVPLYDELNAGFFSRECLSVTRGVVLARYSIAATLEELGKAGFSSFPGEEGGQS
jgi:hypothetical protein